MGPAAIHTSGFTCVALVCCIAVVITIHSIWIKKLFCSSKNRNLNGASQAKMISDAMPVQQKSTVRLCRSISSYFSYSLWIGIILLSLLSCNVTKHVPEGDALYTGAKINLERKEDSSKKEIKGLKDELNGLLRPAPNNSYELYMYNLFYTEKQKGVIAWMKNHVGSPPVLASTVDIDKNRTILENRLQNKGFFDAGVKADTMFANRKMSAIYTASLGPLYRYRNIAVLPDTGTLNALLQEINKKTLLLSGQPYNLDDIKNERTRIDSRLKQKGYYYFNPDYLIADADTTVGYHRVDLNWRVKKEAPAKAQNQYRINDVVIYANYTSSDTTEASLDSAYIYKGYRIIDPLRKYRPVVFSTALNFKKGDLYNRNAHSQSLSRLVNMGVFRFVKVRFEETDTAGANMLNAFYYLSPATKKSVRFEISALTKSNNSNGAEIKLSWGNRNIFRGGEIFNISVYGGLERQVSSQYQNVNTNRYGIDFNLLIPRLIPKLPIKASGNFLPKTSINAGYELFSRTTQYTLSSAKAGYGYVWKRSVSQEHQLKLISINYVRPTDITEEYQNELDTNLTLARSIEKQFIVGIIYNYNYNSLVKPGKRKSNFYFNGNIDLAGNGISLITGGNAKSGNQKEIFGVPYSQYLRLEADIRHYYSLGKTTTLVNRLNAGLGYAYGNSYTMPFVKEFFSGGASSLRGFRARSVGPGTYYGGNPQIKGDLPDQPGDIKLEVNSELRAKLFSYLYGAVFVDAGNVWLFREDTVRPGGRISVAFLNEFAMSTGLGLRVDVSFFVIRLDIAFPIRKPWNTEGSRWVFNEIAFGDSQWRKENLIYNVAIGYPF